MPTSTIMLRVILCWRASGCAEVLAAVSGLAEPRHRPGGHVPARFRHAVLPPVIQLPDAG